MRSPTPAAPSRYAEIQQAAKLGAYIELVWGGLSEDLLRRDVEVIRAVGASAVVLSTDLGQPNNPLHPDGLLAFYKGLMAHGHLRGGHRADVPDQSGEAVGAEAVIAPSAA